MALDSTRRHGRSLTDAAYGILRQRIITGDLPPGAEVSELELAEQLSMSKTPVREALARLGLEGMVEAFPRRGYRVSAVTIKDMNDLFVVRAMLEGTVGAMAALNLSDAELDRLDALADASYVIEENVSVEAFIGVNEDFHTAIALASGNPRLAALVIGHLKECARFFYMGARVRDVNPETSTDHHQIVAVLRRHDAEEARRAMVEHNENTRRGLLQALVAETDGNLQF